MIIFYLLLIPTVYLSLFLLFVLIRHDFVILRRNITLIQIFDKILIAAFFGGFIGRLFYILNSQEFYLFNILAFFHVIRNPGFSIFGFFIGLLSFCILLFRKSKVMLRLTDIVSISFFPVIILNSFFVTFLKRNIRINLGVALMLLIVYIVALRINKSFKVKDGVISCLLISTISIIAFIADIKSENRIIFFFSFSQIIASITLILSLVLSSFIFLKQKRK
mgnify:CR=1 FL=1